MVAEPPADSMPLLTDSATASAQSQALTDAESRETRRVLTFSDMAVHSVDNNGDIGSRHTWRLL